MELQTLVTLQAQAQWAKKYSIKPDGEAIAKLYARALEKEEALEKEMIRAMSRWTAARKTRKYRERQLEELSKLSVEESLKE